MVTSCSALSLRGSGVAGVTTPGVNVGQRRWSRRRATNARWVQSLGGNWTAKQEIGYLRFLFFRIVKFEHTSLASQFLLSGQEKVSKYDVLDVPCESLWWRTGSIGAEDTAAFAAMADQIGLDGIQMLDPSTSRTLRVYPLDTVTRCEDAGGGCPTSLRSGRWLDLMQRFSNSVEATKKKVKKPNVHVAELVYGAMLHADVQQAVEKESSSKAFERQREPISPETRPCKMRPAFDRPSVGMRIKEPKPKKTALPLVKPKNEPVKDDTTQTEVPLSITGGGFSEVLIQSMLGSSLRLGRRHMLWRVTHITDMEKVIYSTWGNHVKVQPPKDFREQTCKHVVLIIGINNTDEKAKDNVASGVITVLARLDLAWLKMFLKFYLTG
ncbi:hypothetical protein Tco_1571604 [Tanacetum coccineum]